MPVQTTYEAEHDPSFEGQRVDLGLTNITSKVAEDSAIAFGRAVVRGTADNQCKLPTTGSQSFLGISEYTSAWSTDGSDIHDYDQYREVNIINFGQIWVYVEESVVPGDPVYFRHTADTSPLDVVGRFRKDSSGGDADLITGASYETTTGAGGIAIVNLNTPGVGVLLAPDSSETLTATTSVTAIDTSITYYDSTSGATTSTLADGTEGQYKYLMMLVDGGDVVVTPANFLNGTTITFNDVGDGCLLRFTGSDWHIVNSYGNVGKGIDEGIITVVATSGAIPLTATIVLLDSTAGVSTASLAAGYAGQRILFKMVTDGGDQVLTPASFVDGTIVTFDNNDYVELLSDGTDWMTIGTPTAAVS